MSWRYQAVWRDDPAGRCYSICELHFDKNDRLDAWTEAAAIQPIGATLDELMAELVHMYVDCARWAPVAFESLRQGMTFDKLISREEAEYIAEMFEGIPVRSRVQGSA